LQLGIVVVVCVAMRGPLRGHAAIQFHWLVDAALAGDIHKAG
jgi:hypothetical protein